MVDQLEVNGVKVTTYYIEEPEHVVRRRYEQRSGKPIPKMHLRNLERYNARDWDHRGTATEILQALRGVTGVNALAEALARQHR